MGKHYISHGNTVSIEDDRNITIKDHLEAEVYSVQFDKFRGFYLERNENFVQLSKVYGDIPKTVDRIITTFMSRPCNTGAMLNGPKGTGKSMTARLTAKRAIEEGYPVIVIQQNFVDTPGYFDFIQSINQACMILFDEYEKIHDKESQEQMLSLFDGIYQSKKLFMLTTNYSYRIDDNMTNRPGRMFYNIKYKSIGSDFIMDYCLDKKVSEDKAKRLCTLAEVFDVFTFDMLQAVVEEMSRYKEDPREAIKLLNVSPEYSNECEYIIKVYHEEKELHDTLSRYNPITEEESVSFWLDANDHNKGHAVIDITPEDIQEFNDKDNEFIYVLDTKEVTNGMYNELTIKAKKKVYTNYNPAF